MDNNLKVLEIVKMLDSLFGMFVLLNFGAALVNCALCYFIGASVIFANASGYTDVYAVGTVAFLLVFITHAARIFSYINLGQKIHTKLQKYLELATKFS